MVVRDEKKWEAVCKNSVEWDGTFFYAISTTGIFCRPSCKSKLPLRKNVMFFDSASGAMAAGFRPCKRCRPDLLHFEPTKELAERAKSLIDRHFAEKQELLQKLEYLGVTRHRMVEIFKGEYGFTMAEYAEHLKMQAAAERLLETDDTVLSVAAGVGFESISSFYKKFVKEKGIPPAAYRKKYQEEFQSKTSGRECR